MAKSQIDKELPPELSSGQSYAAEAIGRYDCVFVTGPAGSGKTYTAMEAALSMLGRKKINKIVITRPAVEAGERLGFLPGDGREKVSPYMQPLYDAVNEIRPNSLQSLIDTKVIEIVPVAFMRGRTFKKAFIILDEAQNCTFSQIGMILTRLGKDSKIVVTGDLEQIDLPEGMSGLEKALQVVQAIPKIETIELTAVDNHRHDLVVPIAQAWASARATATTSGHHPAPIHPILNSGHLGGRTINGNGYGHAD